MSVKSLQKELLEIQRTLGWMDLVLSNISEAVCVVDTSGHIMYANETFAQLAGIQRVFLLGQELCAVFALEQHGELLATMLAGNNDLLKNPDLLDGTYQQKHEAGIRVYRLTSRYLHTLRQTVIMLHDITQQEELDQMRQEFISLASHQLRTPLNVVTLYSEMVHDGMAGELNGQQRLYMANIVDAARRMLSLVNDLLSISGATRGDIERQYQDIDLAKLVRDIVRELRPQMEHRNIRCQVNTVRLPAVSTDPPRLKEILMNLVMNAIQYSHDGGRIAIRVSLNEETVTVAVKDSGIGIPAKNQKRLFSQFYRADNAISHFASGTGLGLYYVKLLTGTLGGDVWFESKENKGSTFYVKLPGVREAREKGSLHA